MKFYNITNIKKFMEKVSETCLGKVDLVNEDGTSVELTDGKGTLSGNLLPLYYLKGTANELTLHFANGDDAVTMLTYLSSVGMPL